MTVAKESLHFLVLEDLSSPAAKAALKPLKASRKIVAKAAYLEELPVVEPYKLNFGHDTYHLSDDVQYDDAPELALHLLDEVD